MANSTRVLLEEDETTILKVQLDSVNWITRIESSSKLVCFQDQLFSTNVVKLDVLISYTLLHLDA